VARSSPGLAFGGMSPRHRLSPANETRLSHAMGTDAFSPERPESSHHFLLLPSPPLLTTSRLSTYSSGWRSYSQGFTQKHPRGVHL
jgi:hypothetical protein